MGQRFFRTSIIALNKLKERRQVSWRTVPIDIGDIGLAEHGAAHGIAVENLVAPRVLVAVPTLELNGNLNRVDSVRACIVIPLVATVDGATTKEGEDGAGGRGGRFGATGGREDAHLLEGVGETLRLDIDGNRAAAGGQRLASHVRPDIVGLFGR